MDLRYFNHPRNALYVFGPENGSIGEDLMVKTKNHVKIASRLCLNLSQSVCCVLYDRQLKETTCERQPTIGTMFDLPVERGVT